jgi:glyoxylase-like metal-dependent hydrolase (beta-lactamase superfamily II)
MDAGLEPNGPELVADLREEGFDPARIRAVILSHGHADHAGGATYLRCTFGTRIVAGRRDAGLLKTGRNDRLCPTSGRARRRLEDDQEATYTPFEADVLIDQEADLQELTGIPGRIVALPGHTEGSLVIVTKPVALVGDLFRGAIVGSSAELHCYMCDLDDNRRDIRALLDRIAPSARTFSTRHFGPVERDAVIELSRQR